MDAVIFDCDGVLIDSETIAHEVGLDALQRIGLFFDSSEYRTRFQGLTVKSWGEALNECHLNQLGAPLPSGFMEQLSADITRRILSDIRPIAGAFDAARAFRGAKAIASSSPKLELHGKVRALGLWDVFGGQVYSGDEVERGKPAPDLFLLAAERLGVAGSGCVVIEDSINGVKAGVAAGMTVWGFSGGPHCHPEQARDLLAVGATRVFADMAALERELSRRG
jgi:HAD superfamily hydrolase (TIGR01509 family)